MSIYKTKQKMSKQMERFFSWSKDYDDTIAGEEQRNNNNNNKDATGIT